MLLSGGYYSIDEELARRGHDSYSFSSYKPNSATQEYRSHVDYARALAEKQKKRVPESYWDKIDGRLMSYERQLAAWFDDKNRTDASVPSWAIAGPSNFPVNKQRKQQDRLSRLFKKYDELDSLRESISSIGTGGINADDPDALERLEAKLGKLKVLHEEMKKANNYRRENGSWSGYDGPLKEQVARFHIDEPEMFQYFGLPNSLAEIHRIEQRIAELKRRNATDFGDGWTFDGGFAKADKENNRLVLKFDEERVPKDVYDKLRHSGFLWSPKNKQFQRKLTDNAIRAAKQLGYIPHDWKAPRTEPTELEKLTALDESGVADIKAQAAKRFKGKANQLIVDKIHDFAKAIRSEESGLTEKIRQDAAEALHKLLTLNKNSTEYTRAVEYFNNNAADIITSMKVKGTVPLSKIREEREYNEFKICAAAWAKDDTPEFTQKLNDAIEIWHKMSDNPNYTDAERKNVKDMVSRFAGSYRFMIKDSDRQQLEELVDKYRSVQ